MFEKIKSYFVHVENEEIPSSTTTASYSVNVELDIINLIREQLKGITINFSGQEESIENSLDENKKKELYANAELLRTNKAFNKIVDHLINVQGNYSIKQAEVMEHVAFGRATINGISLFREEVERLSNLYREDVKAAEDFDPNKMI